MTYHPEYEIGVKSPGVWKEVRRLEAELNRLREVIADGLVVKMNLQDQRDDLLAALKHIGRERCAHVDLADQHLYAAYCNPCHARAAIARAKDSGERELPGVPPNTGPVLLSPEPSEENADG